MNKFVVGLLVFFCGWCTTACSQNTRKSQALQEDDGPPPVEAFLLPLNINTLVSYLGQNDTAFHFQKVNEKAADSKLIAYGYNHALVEISGKNNVISEARYTMPFRTDPAISAEEVSLKIAYFIHTLTGIEGLNWFFAQASKVAPGVTQDYQASDTINGAELIFRLSPSQKNYSITISPVKVNGRE